MLSLECLESPTRISFFVDVLFYHEFHHYLRKLAFVSLVRMATVDLSHLRDFSSSTEMLPINRAPNGRRIRGPTWCCGSFVLQTLAEADFD